jgi:hypothetical protein
VIPRALPLVFLLSSGCAITTDLLYRAVGPGESALVPSSHLPLGIEKSSRKVELDPRVGLVCHYQDEVRVRGSAVTYETVFTNGLRPLTYTFTGLEAGLCLPLVALGGPYRSPYFTIPLGIDLAYGLYRSLTIKPEIRHYTFVYSGWGGSETVRAEEPCPPGTEIVLSADGQTLTVHLDDHGYLAPGELVLLGEFLQIHTGNVQVDGEMRLDLKLVAEVVAAARRARETAEAAEREAVARQAEASMPPPGRLSPHSPPPLPPKLIVRPRAQVYFQPFGPPRVYGVYIDFPLQAVCQSDTMCGPGQRCADRGDGVPLCFGPGALHPFCRVATDCGFGVCLPRPDGVGLCRP